MKLNNEKYLLIISFCLGAMAWQFVYSPDVFAEGGPSAGRKLWNNIMLLVNFGILVFFFLKFAKKPLMNFLHGVRDKLKTDLDTINGQLNDVKSNMDAEEDKLKDIESRIEEIRKNIVEIGKREKEKIIEQAKIAAEKMIENAKAYSNYRITIAKKELSDEMVDIAISVVEERLAKEITDEDNEKLINQFITHLETSKLNFS